MKIDNSARVKAVDSLFDGFIGSGHGSWRLAAAREVSKSVASMKVKDAPEKREL
jgi:hypothetical protein